MDWLLISHVCQQMPQYCTRFRLPGWRASLSALNYRLRTFPRRATVFRTYPAHLALTLDFTGALILQFDDLDYKPTADSAESQKQYCFVWFYSTFPIDKRTSIWTHSLQMNIYSSSSTHCNVRINGKTGYAKVAWISFQIQIRYWILSGFGNVLYCLSVTRNDPEHMPSLQYFCVRSRV